MISTKPSCTFYSAFLCIIKIASSNNAEICGPLSTAVIISSFVHGQTTSTRHPFCAYSIKSGATGYANFFLLGCIKWPHLPHNSASPNRNSSVVSPNFSLSQLNPSIGITLVKLARREDGTAANLFADQISSTFFFCCTRGIWHRGLGNGAVTDDDFSRRDVSTNAP